MILSISLFIAMGIMDFQMLASNLLIKLMIKTTCLLRKDNGYIGSAT